MFQKEKKDFLKKIDKSKKGSIDKKIQNLVKKINKSENYYTTSSCAGRIVLYSTHSSGKKNKFKWHFVSHEKTTFKKVKQTLEKTKEKEVWLGVEPVIIHIAASNTDTAKKILIAARDIGYKRGGIISIRPNRILLELVSTEVIQTILRKNKYQVEDSYLKLLIKEANSKLKKTWTKIDQLKQKIE